MTPDRSPRRPAEGRPTARPAEAAVPAAAAPGLLGGARAWRALAHLPALAFLLAVLAPPLNHDVAAVLSFAERWLAGERLYVDLIDVNPPLVFVLNLAPALVAAWTPLDAGQALLLCLLGLCAGIWVLAEAARRGRREGAVEAAALAALVPLLTLLAGYDFGQREHLMAVMALPYLILAARRAEGDAGAASRRLRLGTALLAGVGFALKPHFLAVPALVEGYVLLRRGRAAWRDPVPWTMGGVWLAYLASVPVLFPDYLGHVVPLVWGLYLDIGDLAWWQVLLTERLGSAALLLAAVLPLALRPRAGALPAVLALAALGALASAVVQHKGWTYHVLPVTLLAAAAAVALAARWLDRALPAARARAAAPALAAVACLTLGLHVAARSEAPWRELAFEHSKGGKLTAFLRRHAYGERLLVLSPDIYPIHPALNYAAAQSTLRTMNLWLLQGVYGACPADGARYRETWEMSRTEFFVYRTVAEDFARAPPAAVLVDRVPGIPWCGREFDFLEYFGRHPLFAATFGRYRPAGEIENYRLWLRED